MKKLTVIYHMITCVAVEAGYSKLEGVVSSDTVVEVRAPYDPAAMVEIETVAAVRKAV